MSKFPHEKKDADTLKQIRAKSDQLISTNSADLGAVATAIGLLKLKVPVRAEGSNIPPDQAAQLMLAMAKSKAAMDRANSPAEQAQLLNAANSLLQGVLAEAESAQKSNETLAVWAWWLSIVLYTIGAAGTVIGQLYGVHVGGGLTAHAGAAPSSIIRLRARLDSPEGQQGLDQFANLIIDWAIARE